MGRSSDEQIKAVRNEQDAQLSIEEQLADEAFNAQSAYDTELTVLFSKGWL